MHPPLIILMRKVMSDFQYKQWTVPAGRTLAASPAISNRMPEHFPQPERYAPERYLAYSVMGHEGDWLQVRVKDPKTQDQQTGWLRARVEIDRADIYDRLPELHLIDAIIGYLTYRVVADGQDNYMDTPWPGTRDGIRRSLGQFVRGLGPGGAGLPGAVGEVLLGAVTLLEGKRTGNLDQASAQARAHFEAAVHMAPAEAAPRNLAAMTEAYACCGPNPAWPPGPVVKAFVKAMTLDPKNADVLANLETLYGVIEPVERAADAQFTAADLSRRQESINRLKARLERTP